MFWSGLIHSWINLFVIFMVCALFGSCIWYVKKFKTVYIESINLGPAITLFICFAFCFSELQGSFYDLCLKSNMHSRSFSQCHFFCCITVWFVLWVRPCMLVGSEKLIFALVEISWKIFDSWFDSTECPCNAIFSFLIFLFYRSCCTILFSC